MLQKTQKTKVSSRGWVQLMFCRHKAARREKLLALSA